MTFSFVIFQFEQAIEELERFDSSTILFYNSKIKSIILIHWKRSTFSNRRRNPSFPTISCKTSVGKVSSLPPPLAHMRSIRGESLLCAGDEAVPCPRRAALSFIIRPLHGGLIWTQRGAWTRGCHARAFPPKTFSNLCPLVGSPETEVKALDTDPLPPFSTRKVCIAGVDL